MNPKIPPPAAALLDFLAIPESGGNYRAYYGHGGNTAPLPATLGAVLAFQHDLVHVRHLPSSAIGRYQFMPVTLESLMGALHLDDATPFTDDLQDALAFQLLKNRGYDRWSFGKLSDDAFADNLSMEWASMPYHTGRSFYAKDGLNRSLVSRAAFVAAIAKAKRLPATVPHIAEPASARLPSCPPSVPASASTTTPMHGTKETAPMHKDILAGLLKTVSGVVLGASEYATVVPNVVGGAIASIDDGRKAAGDVGELIRDVEGGKWGEIVTDVGPIFSDAVNILGNFGVKVPLLGDIAARMPALPSVAGLKAAAA